MQKVLIVYEEVNLQNKQLSGNETHPSIITVSVDEKPGVLAIKNIAPDLQPKPGKHSRWGRDYEYKRLGTVSILAALDLHDGRIIAQVHDRHRSIEFISLLKELAARGIKQELLDRVCAPVGLDIGAETPEEIAVSIMAEIIAVDRGRG